MKGHYDCDVQCPYCKVNLRVRVEWYSYPGTRYDPPVEETNLVLVFPNEAGSEDKIEFDACPHCHKTFTDEDIERLWSDAENMPQNKRFNDTDADTYFPDPETETEHMRADQ